MFVASKGSWLLIFQAIINLHSQFGSMHKKTGAMRTLNILEGMHCSYD